MAKAKIVEVANLITNDNNRFYTMEVNPQVADFWINDRAYQGQRRLDERWVNHLAEEMTKGAFEEYTQLHFAFFNGQSFLINGQHRLWAISYSQTTQWFEIRETDCKSMEEIAELYSNIDIGRKRGNADMYRAMDLHGEFNLSPTNLNTFASAIGYLSTGCERQDNRGNRTDRHATIAGMRLYYPYVAPYFELAIPGPLKNAYRRAATAAVAFLTLRYSSDICRSRGFTPISFWDDVAKDDGLAATDPRKLVNKHLMTTGMISGKLNRQGVTPGHSSRVLASLFSAFVHGQERKITPRVVDTHSALVLPGVPSDHGQWLV